MTEEYWASSPFSIARYYGGISIGGVEYIIVNKEGKDIFECSEEAEKAGREKAIEWVKEGLEIKQMNERMKEKKQ